MRSVSKTCCVKLECLDNTLRSLYFDFDVNNVFNDDSPDYTKYIAP